ncbi:MAG: diaminopimelate epimerase [Thermoguttaceae bacterium]
MTSIHFVKMHGAGNDYIFVDCFARPFPNDPQRLAPKISDRHFGIGGDGLVLIEPSKVADARMRMFNADGSEGEMCGNAIRCVAKYLADHHIVMSDDMRIETKSGVRSLTVIRDDVTWEVRRVRVDMGEPILVPRDIPTTLGDVDRAIDIPFRLDSETTFPVTCVSMGNPHCVVFVEKITDAWVHHVGSKVENAPEFPNRTNVEFVEVISRQELRMRVWERGSGETLACGTGACAVLVAAVLTGRADRNATVYLTGGDLEIAWSKNDNRVSMTGDAIEVFSGTIELETTHA